jgi:hypothetical protein
MEVSMFLARPLPGSVASLATQEALELAGAAKRVGMNGECPCRIEGAGFRGVHHHRSSI